MRVTFNNRENECITSTEGRSIWVSRSCAVVAEVCMYSPEDNSWYVLLGKRGSGTPDFQGYWCLPCGYLDWNETLCQAMVREVWEECGLYLPHLSQNDQYINSNSPSVKQQENLEDQAWYIADKPTTEKQNISFHFAILFSWRSQPFPEITNAHCEPNEVSEVKWFKIEEAMIMELAFNHAHRLQCLVKEKADWFSSIEQTAIEQPTIEQPTIKQSD